MPKKIVTFGEIMLRLSTPDYKRFVQADTLMLLTVVAKPMWLQHFATMAKVCL